MEEIELNDLPPVPSAHFVPEWCFGEACRICDQPASHKVEESMADNRHPFTAYVCCEHFAMIMGDAVFCKIPPPLSEPVR